MLQKGVTAACVDVWIAQRIHDVPSVVSQRMSVSEDGTIDKPQ